MFCALSHAGCWQQSTPSQSCVSKKSLHGMKCSPLPLLFSIFICFPLSEGLVTNLRRIRLRSNSTGTRPSPRRDNRGGGPRRLGQQLETPEKQRLPPGCKVPKSASASGLSLLVTPGRRAAPAPLSMPVPSWASLTWTPPPQPPISEAKCSSDLLKMPQGDTWSWVSMLCSTWRRR